MADGFNLSMRAAKRSEHPVWRGRCAAGAGALSLLVGLVSMAAPTAASAASSSPSSTAQPTGAATGPVSLSAGSGGYRSYRLSKVNQVIGGKQSTLELGYSRSATKTGTASPMLSPSGSTPLDEVPGPDWQGDYFTSSPGALSSPSMAYDSGHDADVLFGGYTSSGSHSDQTWLWEVSDGVQDWYLQSPSSAPSARSNAAMAYDPSLNETILFGGYGSSGTLGDTWAWNGSNWSQLSPSTAPPALAAASMVWDASASEMVLFGGETSSGTVSGQTWVFNGTTWSQLAITGPSAREYAAMAYDSGQRNVVLFGGDDGSLDDNGETWTFDGTAWSEQSPYDSPTARTGALMSWDPSLNRVVLVGGVEYDGEWLNDNWDYDQALGTWQAMSPNIDIGPTSFTGLVPAANGHGVVTEGGESDSAGDLWGWTEHLDWQPSGSSDGDQYRSFQMDDQLSLKVDLNSGNVVVTQNELGYAGTGINMQTGSYYNYFSNQWAQLQLGNMSEPMIVSGPDGDMIIDGVDGDTNGIVFTPDGSNYTPPAGTDATLQYDSTAGTFKYIDNASQGEIVFPAPVNGAGYIASAVAEFLKDRNGNTISINGGTEVITDTRGRTISETDDTSTDTATLTGSDGRSWTWTANGNAQYSHTTDPNSQTTTFGYDSTTGLLDQITDPDGHIVLIGYDSAYFPDSITQVTDTTNDTGPTTTFDAAAVSPGTSIPSGTVADHEMVVTDPNGNATAYIDAADGQTIQTVDALGHSQGSSYSPDRQPQQLTDGLTQVTTLAYDTNNNLTQITSPASGTGQTPDTSYQLFNSSGFAGSQYQPSSATDAEGNCSSFSYDSNGNQTGAYLGLTPDSTHGCNGGTSGTGVTSVTNTYQGDPGVPSCGAKLDELCTTTIGGGNVTSYGYDSSGEVTSITQPGGSCSGTRKLCTTIGYDSASRPTTVTDGKGQATGYSYDGDNRITQILYNGATTCTHSAGTCVSYGYDADGNVTSRVDSTGTTTFGYDDLNRLTSEALPSGADACSGSSPAAITYGWDAASNLTSYCDANGTVGYAYDQANRMVGVATGSGSCTLGSVVQPCTQYGYNNNNQLTSITYPTTTGVTDTFGVNNAGDVTSATAAGGGITSGSLTYSYNYTSGTNDKPLIQAVTAAGSTTDYAYNGHEQLTGTSGAATNSYGYDSDGNLASETTAGTTRSLAYNTSDELCWALVGTSANACGSAPSGATTYSYDADGNQTASSAGLALAYNPVNQTTSMTNATGGNTLAMSYTGTDSTQRTAVGSNALTNNVWGVASQTCGCQYFTRDPSGRLNSIVISGTRYYYIYDGTGNIVALINASGSEVAKYTYDPYGNTLTSSGSEASSNPYRYKGGYTDPTGYIKYGTRYYNPTLGSWTQQDAIAGGIQSPGAVNRYPYVADDPINNTDPTGKCVLGLVGSHCGSVVHALFGSTRCLKQGVAVGTLTAAGAAVATTPLDVPGVIAAGAVTFAGGDIFCELGFT